MENVFIEHNVFIEQVQQLVTILNFNLDGTIPDTHNKSKPSTSQVEEYVSHISDSQIGLFTVT